MLNYKKILAFGIALFAVLICLTKIRAGELATANRVSCVESSCASLSKASDFNIVNILSVKFR